MGQQPHLKFYHTVNKDGASLVVMEDGVNEAQRWSPIPGVVLSLILCSLSLYT